MLPAIRKIRSKAKETAATQRGKAQMNRLASIIDASRSTPDRSGLPGRGKHAAVRTMDYRKMLSEMRQRPPSQRTFLKKLLRRAAITGVAHKFPVANHAALNLVDHT